MFGDLFQLPPVAKRQESYFFYLKYGGIFFFNSEAYKKGDFKFKELNQNFRQTEQEFINILNDIRIGKITDEAINSLNKHYVIEVPRRVVQVVSKKDEANRINMNNLAKIDSKQYEYKADILVGSDIKETDFICDFDLKLKVGALVMLITNDLENKRWVNGTLGIISGLSNDLIKVTINGNDYNIAPTTFNKYKCKYDIKEKKIKYVVESSVS